MRYEEMYSIPYTSDEKQTLKQCISNMDSATTIATKRWTLLFLFLTYDGAI
jgi:hypothetical protein